LAGGEVVQEEQRLGALHQHIVDAHGDQVDADAVVPVQLLRQLELGADAVGAADQHRLAVLARQVEQGAEAAQAAHHFRAEGALDQGLDALDDFVAGVDVDTRVAVGEGAGLGHDGIPTAGGKAAHSSSPAAPAPGPVGRGGRRCGTMRAAPSAVPTCARPYPCSRSSPACCSPWARPCPRPPSSNRPSPARRSSPPCPTTARPAAPAPCAIRPCTAARSSCSPRAPAKSAPPPPGPWPRWWSSSAAIRRRPAIRWCGAPWPRPT